MCSALTSRCRYASTPRVGGARRHRHVGSTAPGQPQGRVWGQQLVVVNEVTAIDLATHTATLLGANGQSRTIAVKDPEMQDRMRNLRVGDLVELTYSEAVAAKILPKS